MASGMYIYKYICAYIYISTYLHIGANDVFRCLYNIYRGGLEVPEEDGDLHRTELMSLCLRILELTCPVIDYLISCHQGLYKEHPSYPW